MSTSVSIRDEWDAYAAAGKPKGEKSAFSSLFSVFKPSGDGAEEPLIDENSLDEVPDGSSDKDSWFPSLTRAQRFVGFFISLCVGVLCFMLAGFYIPVLILRARKFAVLFTFGSLFMMGSFSFLMGPWNHLKSLGKTETLPFSGAYVGTLAATLYCALSLQSTILTVIFAIAQVVALVWFILHHIPGGDMGMKLMTRLFTKTVMRTLPV